MTKLWCLVCKKEFETKKRRVAYFCSPACRKAASRRYAKLRREAEESFIRYAEECTAEASIVEPTRTGDVAPKV